MTDESLHSSTEPASSDAFDSLSTRTKNTLRSGGFTSIASLKCAPRDMLFRLPGFGQGATREVEAVLGYEIPWYPDQDSALPYPLEVIIWRCKHRRKLRCNADHKTYEEALLCQPSSDEAMLCQSTFYDEKTIDELCLSHRPANCLKTAGINTIKDLVAMKPSQVFSLPRLGRHSLNEIMEQLANRGLRLR